MGIQKKWTVVGLYRIGNLGKGSHKGIYPNGCDTPKEVVMGKCNLALCNETSSISILTPPSL